MKISNEQIVALQETIARRKEKAATGDFENLLQQTISTRQVQGVAPLSGVQNLQSTAQALQGAEQLLGAENQTAKTDGGFGLELENILGSLEAYSRNLGKAEKADLRLAHAQLETMSKGLEALKESFPEMHEQNPELAGLFTELEVLATTERFKFNRGDYL